MSDDRHDFYKALRVYPESDYEALAARLAEAERALTRIWDLTETELPVPPEYRIDEAVGLLAKIGRVARNTLGTADSASDRHCPHGISVGMPCSACWPNPATYEGEPDDPEIEVWPGPVYPVK
jgi:hypothetical protein